MQPSSRIRAILGGGASGWEVVHRARKMQRQGVRIIDLTVGQHEDPTPAPILEAMHASAMGGNTRYSDVAGSSELRAAIAERAAARTGAPAGPENVVVTAGGQAALLHAFMATLDAGDAAVMIDPYYVTYPGTIRATGGVPRITPARAEAGFQPDLDALEAACAGARVLLVNSPNNPAGAIYSDETLDGVAEICRRHDLWLISDEVYDGMAWDQPHRSPRALPGMAERTVVIGSLSKSHGMTGSRIGWTLAPEEISALIATYALNATYGIPGFIQDAGLWALREGEAIEADLAGTFHRRRDIAMRALAGRQAVRLSPPQGAMYVMVDVRATGLSGRDFAERLLEEAHIAVMPGESFGASAAGHLRIALTVADADLATALTRIADLAETLAAERAAAG
ncbi:pyridoxal phosphate-dependent aminotransferase [Albimonas pacifica]|uniref:Aminotransferase n=1 Tax=Albimonas pacifica TaxID=1114924 RepID=A0A1I3I1I5_9RHOB|nr:aminotransferase class I/II-fold pyridoxal phosphate-dependent enzyme [Albimonas pacifica]SFI41752.1 arginine:pyruvate transaminase [Albimonas pacifica]